MCFLTMFVKRRRNAFFTLLLHILLRESTLSARHHVCFVPAHRSAVLFFFLSFLLLILFDLFLISPVFFLPSLPPPFFSFCFSFVLSLFCKLGVLVRHRISLFGKETVGKFLSMAIRGFSLLILHCVVCCYVAWVHDCMAACMATIGQTSSWRLCISNITYGKMEGCVFPTPVPNMTENGSILN